MLQGECEINFVNTYFFKLESARFVLGTISLDIKSAFLQGYVMSGKF